MTYLGNWTAIHQSSADELKGWAAWVLWRTAYLTRSMSIRNKISKWFSRLVRERESFLLTLVSHSGSILLGNNVSKTTDEPSSFHAITPAIRLFFLFCANRLGLLASCVDTRNHRLNEGL